MTSPLDYEVLNDRLEHDRIAADAAELQGQLCAQVTLSDTTVESWLGQALGEEADANALARETGEALIDLYSWTCSALNEGAFAFKLFLPDDDLGLTLRTEALTHWCQGYLAGLGLAGLADPASLPEETREFLEDLAEIARADFETEDGGESDEVAFTELVEYARVGAMMVFETLRGPDAGDSIH